MTGRASPRIAIVGGGFSGAAVATHLARRAAMPLAVDVIEPRETLGGGVAYSALDPAHRTNVAAARMNLFTDEPGHFERWLDSTGALADDPDARLPDGRAYPRRRVFGEYVAAQLATAASCGQAVVRHLRDRAVEIQPQRGGWLIELGSGGMVMADLVVLAVSHPPPEPPRHLLEAFATQPGLVADPWAPDALDSIKAIDTVVIMGAALSMADVVASLERRGHRGRIVAFSRRGLVSRAHAATNHDAFGDFATDRPATAVEILRRVRRAIGAAESAGQPWQAVIDAVRRDGQAVWHGLSRGQRGALLRHLRPYWEVHRYRIAPQVGAIIERRREAGTLEIVAAGLGRVEVAGGKIRTELLLRGRHADGQRREIESDAFVLTTGPAHASALQSNPALRSLAEQGCVQADPLGLGLLVDRQNRALARSGLADGTLLVAGPMARATFGELMGLPQVAEHAEDVADAVLSRLRRDDAARTQVTTSLGQKPDNVGRFSRQQDPCELVPSVSDDSGGSNAAVLGDRPMRRPPSGRAGVRLRSDANDRPRPVRDAGSRPATQLTRGQQVRQPSVLGIAGSVRQPSRTTNLVAAVVDAISGRLGMPGEVVELVDRGSSFFDAMSRDAIQGRALEIVEAIEAAEVLVVGTPVYRASYTGLFKHVFDLVHHEALIGKTVVLTATGGSPLHGLVMEHQLRPLFGFFRAHTVPSAVYATEADFDQYTLSSPAVLDRIARATDEVVRLAGPAASRRPAAVAAVA